MKDVPRLYRRAEGRSSVYRSPEGRKRASANGLSVDDGVDGLLDTTKRARANRGGCITFPRPIR